MAKVWTEEDKRDSPRNKQDRGAGGEVSINSDTTRTAVVAPSLLPTAVVAPALSEHQRQERISPQEDDESARGPHQELMLPAAGWTWK